MFSTASPGSNIPHRCNSTKHRIISPKLPAPYPALTELQNLANEGSGAEVGREAGPGDASVAVVPSERKQPPEDRIEDMVGVASPCSASSSSSSSPPQTQRAATIALSNGNGFQRGGLATVALPQNAVIVMTTAAAPVGRGCGEEPNGETRLSLTRAGGRLVLSPVPPKQDTPSPPSSASPPSPIPANQGVATLSLTLLPSPVIGGLLLTDRIIPEAPGTLLHPSSPSPSLLPFDPDSFLNSPKQGQTYGGPASISASSSPSPPPSTSPQPPSLALSLSPTSPPSSLSSLSSETERKSIPGRPASSPASFSFSLSPTRTTPALLQMYLETSLGLDSLSPSLSVPPTNGRAPPTGFNAQATPTHPLTNQLSPSQHVNNQLAAANTTTSLEVLPTNQLPQEGEKAELMQSELQVQSCLLTTHSMCIQPQNLTPPPATPTNVTPIQVKEEQSPPTNYDSEVTPMDTTHCAHIDDEEAGLTFDSTFPDLISELITEETVSHAPAPSPPIYPIRYMVPPQPTPSTSFLPFPLLTHTHSLASGGAPEESQRLANITDFSPEWSYPEV